MAPKTTKRPSNVAKKSATKRASATAPRTRKAASSAQTGASNQIDARIEELGGWRGQALSRVRRMIKQAVPDVVEELKWKKPTNPNGVPVWSYEGVICTGETYKDKVKFTFFNGAALEDPAGLFNAGFGGGTRRAIDLHEGDKIDSTALKALVRGAAALNASKI